MDFVKQHPDENLAEHIHKYAPADIEPWRVGAFFDSLVWAPYSDNGGLLMETLEYWLRGNDPRKIQYALAIQGVFPFKTASEMEKAFARIKLQWPELTARCDEITAGRKRSCG